MHISSLYIAGVRQFEEKTVEFSPGFNLLVGENGAGKTTIIRALLAAVGGANQRGPYPKLDDEDIRLNSGEAIVRAKVDRPNRSPEIYSYSKALWAQGDRSHKRYQRPLVLKYSSNEATCSSMRGRKVKRFRGVEDPDTTRYESFLFYGNQPRSSQEEANQSGRRFGDSRLVREFLGKVLSTFSPDFQDFYWRFEPYDCSLLLPPGESKENLIDEKTEKAVRSAALRHFQEDLTRGKRLYRWPDQEKVVLSPPDASEGASKRRAAIVESNWRRAISRLPRDSSGAIVGSAADASDCYSPGSWPAQFDATVRWRTATLFALRRYCTRTFSKRRT